MRIGPFEIGRVPSAPALSPVQEQLVAKLAGLEDALAVKLMESIDLSTSYVDPTERFMGPNGELWTQIGGSTGADGRSPGDTSNFSTEAALTAARNECRQLARDNSYAINLHENMVNYIVGPDPKHTVVAKQGEEVSDEQKAAVQDVIDEWCYENAWGQKQHEGVLRYDRDGEYFRRFHQDESGKVRIRYIEPTLVAQPDKPEAKDDWFGVRTEPEDVETVLGYWVDGDFVEAAEVQHVKANVDSNVRRGVPTCWPIRKMLRRAVSVLDSIGVVSEIQTSIAIIRSHIGGTKDGLERKRSGAATSAVTSPTTGQTSYFEQYKKGRVIDISENTKYEFPADGLNCEQYAAGVAAIVRGAAARVCMPEFMFSSDASNANYASTMVAEGPAVKMFERRQAILRDPDLKVLWWVLERASENGDSRVPADVLEKIEIQSEPPTVAVRDGLKEAQENQILKQEGVISIQTWQAKVGLDPKQEEANMAEYEKLHPAPEADPLAALDKAAAAAREHIRRTGGLTE